MLSLLHVVGTRPNLVKLAPVVRAGARCPGVRQVIVHTGQHYDTPMSAVFFKQLELPDPEENLQIGSGSHAQQTAEVMQRLDPVLERRRPDWVVVYGDVNSTVAATLTAVKRGIRVAHVEAGLRSRDRTMPEEINRIVTDAVADCLLAPSRDAVDNLRREGIPAARIRFVGNVMVDSLLYCREAARDLEVAAGLGLSRRGFVFVTLHRPSNVDDRETLTSLLLGLGDLARTCPVVFPMHPRTEARVEAFGLGSLLGSIRVMAPLGYLEALSLVQDAALVLTDSGGLQEESTVLGVPCLTARPNTERPITVLEGTNHLVASSRSAIVAEATGVLRRHEAPRGHVPEGWDGHAAERILEVLQELDAPRRTSTAEALA